MEKAICLCHAEEVLFSDIMPAAFDLGVIKSASMVTAFDGITAHKAGEDVELTHRCMDAFARSTIIESLLSES